MMACFRNRGLFTDDFLKDRLPDDAAWCARPDERVEAIRDLTRAVLAGRSDNGPRDLCEDFYEPVFRHLGFRASRSSTSTSIEPDYLLEDAARKTLSAAFVFPWGRWLDGPDSGDAERPGLSPTTVVVAALDRREIDWIIVTNGQQWRLYNRHVHGRASKFYEADLIAALSAAPVEDAFRYWWLFFRAAAFQAGKSRNEVWLDAIVQGSRDLVKRAGDRLEERVVRSVVPCLAQGFLDDRRTRLGRTDDPNESELADVFEAALALLYRLLFLLHAHSRDLLSLGEKGQPASCLRSLVEDIANEADTPGDGVSTAVYGRVAHTGEGEAPSEPALIYRRVFEPMDHRVPHRGSRHHTRCSEDSKTRPPNKAGSDGASPSQKHAGAKHEIMSGAAGVRNANEIRSRGLEQRYSTVEACMFEDLRVLCETFGLQQAAQRSTQVLTGRRISDYHFALALDQLARDQDESTHRLVPVDFKALDVRHLGSIHERLLAFKLVVAGEDKVILPARGGQGRGGVGSGKVAVRKGEVYLSDDRASRKATGVFYTPDSIVTYIVAQTVGPVLDEKLETLRTEFLEFRATFDHETKGTSSVAGDEGETVRRAYDVACARHGDLVDRLFDLAVLDPASGSGHFLVAAADFITDRLLAFLSAFPINPVTCALEQIRCRVVAELVSKVRHRTSFTDWHPLNPRPERKTNNSPPWEAEREWVFL